MTPTQQKKIEHLNWVIESCYRNQKYSARLLSQLLEHADFGKTQLWSRAAQNLFAVTFSLWCAAFLADKTAKRGDVFNHEVEFLEKVVEDNAITYVQEWKSS